MKIMNDFYVPPELNRVKEKVENKEEKSFAGVLETAMAAKDDKQLKEAAQQMEALFLYQLFTEMRKTVPKGGLFGEPSLATDIFKGLLDQEVSIQSSLNGGAGLAEVIYLQMRAVEKKV